MEQSKRKFLKNMVGFSMVTWISFAISFISTPIATRLFPTEELGKINIFLTYSSLFSSACYFGLDQAFVRFFNEPPGDMSRKGLFTVCALFPVTLCVVCVMPASFFWRGLTTRITAAPNLSVFICLCVFSICQVLYRFLSLSYRMEQNAKLYTLQGVLYAILTRLAYLSVGFNDPRGADAIMLLTVLMGLFALAFIIMQRKRFEPSAIKRVNKQFAGSVAAFALPLVPLTVISELSNSVSKLALNDLLGLSATAIYSSALGLATTINIIQTGFNTYWAPYVYENYKLEGARRFYMVHKLMACMLTLFGLAMSILQAPVFLLLGSSYRSSVAFFPFLFISPICYCLGETTCMGINISKRTYWTTLIYVFSVASNIALCYLLIPSMGMVGAALAAAFSGILTLLLRTFLGGRYYKVLDSWRYLYYSVGLMLAASFASYFLSGAAKYAVLAALIPLALLLFRHELRTLWTTAMQIKRAGVEAIKRRRAPHEE